MKKYSYYEVSAFTTEGSNGPFSGNPAGVVLLDNWLPETTMQRVAEQNNLAETAFLVPEGAGYRIRWFTPTSEIDLCGHATLGSAFALFHAHQASPRGGDLWLQVKGDRVLLQGRAQEYLRGEIVIS